MYTTKFVIKKKIFHLNLKICQGYVFSGVGNKVNHFLSWVGNLWPLRDRDEGLFDILSGHHTFKTHKLPRCCEVTRERGGSRIPLFLLTTEFGSRWPYLCPSISIKEEAQK